MNVLSHPELALIPLARSERLLLTYTLVFPGFFLYCRLLALKMRQLGRQQHNPGDAL